MIRWRIGHGSSPCRSATSTELPLHQGKQQALTGFAEYRHLLVVVENAPVRVDAAVISGLDTLAPVDRRANMQAGELSLFDARNTGFSESELLHTSGPAVFLGIDASIDEPLVAGGGMKARSASGEVSRPGFNGGS